jgi:NitT/TauT family transport system ATP-binding protein
MSFLNVDLQHKTYPNGVCAVQDLRFSANQGEFVALVGPSGTGKSTLLNLIAGLDTDFTGQISLPPDTTLSFMFQEPRLLPWLSVADNIRRNCSHPLPTASKFATLSRCPSSSKTTASNSLTATT